MTVFYFVITKWLAARWYWSYRVPEQMNLRGFRTAKLSDMSLLDACLFS